MIEFYKYLYTGGFALRSPYDYQKISQKYESQPNVSSCPANFTPVANKENEFATCEAISVCQRKIFFTS